MMKDDEKDAWINVQSWLDSQILLKGKVHPKMKFVLSFTHPHLVPNLYELLSSAEHKQKYSGECQ